jgi:hypothetical protein
MEKLTWGSHELKPDGELNLNLGELGVSIRGESDELWISSHRENQPTEIQIKAQKCFTSTCISRQVDCSET